MTTQPAKQRLAAWTESTQDALRDYAKLFPPFFHEPRLPSRTEYVIGQLHLRCTLTSDTVLALVTQQKYWDAEMPSRSVLEGTCKLAFIGLAAEAEREARVQEFLEDLPAIASMRRHERIIQLLAGSPDRDEPTWKPLRDIMLSDQDFAALRSRYPKAMRGRLEQKWSFANVVHDISHAHPAFGSMKGVLYFYGMSSHVIHQDGDALLMMWEREQRSRERVEAIELAHAARLCGDLLAFSMLRVYAAYKAKGLPADAVIDCSRHHERFLADLHEIESHWRDIEYGRSD